MARDDDRTKGRPLTEEQLRMVSDLAAAPSNAEESKIETFRRLRGRERERWAFFREHFLGWSLLAVGIVALIVAIVVHMLILRRRCALRSW